MVILWITLNYINEFIEKQTNCIEMIENMLPFNTHLTHSPVTSQLPRGGGGGGGGGGDGEKW